MASPVQGDNPCRGPAGHTSAGTSQDSLGLIHEGLIYALPAAMLHFSPQGAKDGERRGVPSAGTCLQVKGSTGSRVLGRWRTEATLIFKASLFFVTL